MAVPSCNLRQSVSMPCPFSLLRGSSTWLPHGQPEIKPVIPVGTPTPALTRWCALCPYQVATAARRAWDCAGAPVEPSPAMCRTMFVQACKATCSGQATLHVPPPFCQCATRFRALPLDWAGWNRREAAVANYPCLPPLPPAQLNFTRPYMFHPCLHCTPQTCRQPSLHYRGCMPWQGQELARGKSLRGPSKANPPSGLHII